jgi:hypothetical protein
MGRKDGLLQTECKNLLGVDAAPPLKATNRWGHVPTQLYWHQALHQHFSAKNATGISTMNWRCYAIDMIYIVHTFPLHASLVGEVSMNTGSW